MDEEQELAATRMAAAQRGKHARREANEQKQAASKVAAAQKGKNDRRESKKKKEAATKVQAMHRGRTERSKGDSAGQRYYTSAEIAMHNTADNLWVTMFGKVHNLTQLVAENPGHLVQPIIEAAGTDISHWFDPVTKQVKTFIDPKTELEVPFCPMGEFLHCAPTMPTDAWSSNIGKPWWKDKSSVIGLLTVKTRKVNLFNMLTKQETVLVRCCSPARATIYRQPRLLPCYKLARPARSSGSAVVDSAQLLGM